MCLCRVLQASSARCDMWGVAPGPFSGLCLKTALIELQMYVLFPVPASVDINDALACQAFIEGLPAQALLGVQVPHLT